MSIGLAVNNKPWVKSFFAYIIFSTIFVLFLWRSIFSSILIEEPLKSGTDAAGYSIIAKEIRNGTHLSEIANIGTTGIGEQVLYGSKESGVPINDWETSIAPNSFRYNERLQRIMSQYPPGTSFLMAAFPKVLEVRGIVLITSFVISWLFLRLFRVAASTSWFWAAGILLIGLFFGWFLREYISHSFSLYPTLVICMIMSILSAQIININLETAISRRRIRSINGKLFLLFFVCGLSVIVRTSNVFLLLPALSLYILLCAARNSRDYARHFSIRTIFRNLFKRRLLTVLAAYGAGLFPLLLWNYLATGDLVFSNYPWYDKAVVESPYQLWGNMERLLLRSGPDSSLIIFTIVGILLAISHYRNSRSLCLYWKLALASYVFVFLVVSVKYVVTSYYMSSLSAYYFILFLCCLSSGSADLKRIDCSFDDRRLMNILDCIASIFIVIAATLPYRKVFSSEGHIPSQASALNSDCSHLGSKKQSVVWSTEESGYLYLNCGIWGLRHQRMPNSLAHDLFIRLDGKGYTQYVEGSVLKFKSALAPLRIVFSDPMSFHHLRIQCVSTKLSFDDRCSGFPPRELNRLNIN